MRRLASEPPTAHRHSRGDDTMPTAKPTSRPKHTPKHTRDMTEEEIKAWMAADDTPEDLADSEPVWSGTFAEAMRREQAIRQRGRPRTESPKVRTSIYLSRSVLEKFKATGPGWQTRINEVLERAKV